MKIPVGRIPKYISASSPQGLQRIMLQVQSNLGYGVEFKGYQETVLEYKDGKAKRTKYSAWYYDNDNITLHNVEAKLNGNRD